MEFDRLIRLSTAQVSGDFPTDFREDLIWLLSAYQTVRDELDMRRAKRAGTASVAAQLLALATEPSTPPALRERLARLCEQLQTAVL
jgi:hypothetical protein